MSNSLRIAEIADRAGISTATVRYYERIGVLPIPERSADGYRMYDAHTVERLEFIGRAKQLGCSLDEVTDLAQAWEGGECGPIQDRLRTLVSDKLAAAQTEIVELVTLTADLRRAAAALGGHRPVGRCDDTCGCTFNNRAEALPVPIAFTERPATADTPITCTLDAGQMPDRIVEWNTLVGFGTDRVTRTAIAGGVRLHFRDTVDVAEIARLATAEQNCCQFFTFRIAIDQHGVALEVTASGDAIDIVHTAFEAPA